jgi:hypothetical protein
MNKKWIAVGVCIVAGAALLFTTAFAGANDTAGYEAYKSAVKNMAQVRNLTGNFEFSLMDNGTELLDASSVLKTDMNNDVMSSSTSVKSGDEEMKMDTYQKDGKVILKNSDSEEYNVIEHKERKYDNRRAFDESRDPEAMKLCEAVVDTLAGDLKNYFTYQKNQDGTGDVALHLSQNQISPVVNGMVSLAVRNAAEDNRKGSYFHLNDSDFGHAVDMNLPQLVSDIRIDSVDMTAEINSDNTIGNQMLSISLEGKDAQGKTHDIVFSVDMKLDGINSTNPDTVDLTGKQVKVIEMEGTKGRN